MIIAVCDDQGPEREHLVCCLNRVLREQRISAEVAAFASAEEMLAAMGDRVFGINFLDIYMQGASGVQLAREIIRRAPNAAVVFTTASRDHMAEGFAVGAVHYLVKPFTREDVSVALDRCLRLVGRAEPYVELCVERERKKLLFSQIVYVEFQNRYCVVHTPKEELRTYLRLDELQEELSDGRFLRCHRSFLINLDYVSGVSGNEFILDGGQRVPMRREERAVLKAAFEDYCFEKSRRETGWV